jgi:CelD/BcsL family acetyltransferase involved in cellulose biosynthesis
MTDISLHRTALRCEVVTEFERLRALFPEWERLWERDARAEAFQSPAWATAWWQAFGHHCTLHTVAVFAARPSAAPGRMQPAAEGAANEELVGIVPLVRRDGVLQLLGMPEADYGDIVCEEKWAAEVMAAAIATLRQSVPGWKECVWQHLSDDSRIMRFYKTLPRGFRGRLHRLPTEHYQTILFGDGNDRETVLSSIVGKKHTRRRINKLRKAGRVRFRELAAEHAAGADLDNFFRHHVRRHAAIGKSSAYADAESCQFVRTLFHEMGSAARFGVLELNRRPLAWYFGFQSKGKFLLYQHTFDLEMSEYTPGELLLWNLFEYARDHVARELDFGHGNEPYKTRFTNSSRQTFCLFLEPRSLAGWARGLARRAQALVFPWLLHARQFAKSHRPTLRAFRSLRILAQRVVGGSHPAQVRSANSGLRLREEPSGAPVLPRRPSAPLAAKASAAGCAGSFASAEKLLSDAALGRKPIAIAQHPHAEVCNSNRSTSNEPDPQTCRKS